MAEFSEKLRQTKPHQLWENKEVSKVKQKRSSGNYWSSETGCKFPKSKKAPIPRKHNSQKLFTKSKLLLRMQREMHLKGWIRSKEASNKKKDGRVNWSPPNEEMGNMTEDPEISEKRPQRWETLEEKFQLTGLYELATYILHKIQGRTQTAISAYRQRKHSNW